MKLRLLRWENGRGSPRAGHATWRVLRERERWWDQRKEDAMMEAEAIVIQLEGREKGQEPRHWRARRPPWSLQEEEPWVAPWF